LREKEIMFNSLFERSTRLPNPEYIRPAENNDLNVTDIGVAADNEYTIDVATDPDFSNIVATVNSKTLDLKTVPGVANGSPIYIRSKVDNGIKASGYSTINGTYYTQPGIITLSTPGNFAQINQGNLIAISFTGGSDAVTVELQLSESDTFNTLTSSQVYGINDSIIINSSTLGLTRYYWRIKGINELVYGPWSDFYCFDVILGGEGW